MCGIAGIFGARYSEPQLQEQIRRMTATLVHRGPDCDGILVRAHERIALGHRRLAIQDLSDAGAQPMSSPSGRYVIVFNGEIYNVPQLKAQLLSEVEWRGHSDTEVLLAAFEQCGIRRTLELTAGMFALALYDGRDRKLYLMRDRFGEKPLYYARHRGGVVFASELKGLLALSDLEPRICREAVVLLLKYNYIPAPYTILEGVGKVMPATVVTTDGASTQEERYWDPAAIVGRCGADRAGALDFKRSAEELRERLRQAVRGQLVSDVSIGAFLSGGVDSSLICAIMQEQSPVTVNTYTIGFQEPQFNEAGFAREVARHLGTHHTEYYVSAKDALALVETLPAIFDEPFADSSQLPTLLLTRMVSRDVKVALSGDGGDELFAGYARYAVLGRRRPAVGMRVLARALLRRRGHTVALAGAARAVVRPVSVCTGLPQWIVEHKLKRRLIRAGEDLTAAYQYLNAQWCDPASLTAGSVLPDDALARDVAQVEATDRYRAMMLLDVHTYLPDDLLVKVDRAAMHYSLETRAPFLDHRLYEYSATLPTSYLVDEAGGGKRILRHLLHQYVPRGLVDRPKAGFAAPLAKWLRTELADWAESLVYGPELAAQSFIDPQRAAEVWRLHKQGRGDYSFHLWGLLQLCAWQRLYRASW
ncbi:MAG: asparagine synthase (glutamine-hydrolyzing) [Steroidobacteraceae bacterium]